MDVSPELTAVTQVGSGFRHSKVHQVFSDLIQVFLSVSSLVSSMLKQQCVCVLSWKLMESVWRRGGGGGREKRRDIYSEMLDEPHTCPLTQVNAPVTFSLFYWCKRTHRNRGCGVLCVSAVQRGPCSPSVHQSVRAHSVSAVQLLVFSLSEVSAGSWWIQSDQFSD